jgi:hypothetical protein
MIGGKREKVYQDDIQTQLIGVILMDEAQLDSLLKKLAVYLANELDKRGDLLSRLEDLEDSFSRENFSEDDVREWISDAINNAEISVDISA